MKKQYDLDEAIKTFYKTQPLKINLAATVANKVYAKRKKNFAVLDKCLYCLLLVLVVVGVIYCLSLIKQSSVLPMFLLAAAVVTYLVLSYKEYAIMSKRLLSSV